MTSEVSYTSRAIDNWMKESSNLKVRKEIHRGGRNDEVSREKIQRVPEYMRAPVELEKFFLPNFISIGPIHFATPYVEPGVAYKFMWTAMYLEDTNQTYDDLFRRIVTDFQKLSQLFASTCWPTWDIPQIRPQLKALGFVGPGIEAASVPRPRYKMEEIVQVILMVDGCSILQVLDKSVHDDPELELRISIQKLVQVHQDLLLLENQIPYQLLKLLCNNDEARLERCMHNFLQVHGIRKAVSRTGKQEDTSTRAPEHNVVVQEDDDPVHLLDYLRRALLKRDLGQIQKEIKINQSKSMHLRKYRIGTIRELKAAGIRIRKYPNDTNGFFPSFDAGQLQLPVITVDGSTAVTFLNLIAYEMCPDSSSDFEISSYVVFLSSLIDQPEDVKELRNAGILRNELASDKEVADLFNKMDTVLVPERARFAHIRDLIEAHFESKRGRIKVLGWMGEAYNTYFRSPWTVIALLAATLGLTLTFIQTWFAIHPKS